VVFKAGEESNLRLPVLTRKRYIRLTFQDGDNPPLTVTRVRGEYRLQEVVFEAPSKGTYEVLVGRERAQAPQYDLAAFVARVKQISPLRLQLGPLARNPVFEAEPEKPPLPWTERHRTLLAGILTLLTLGLGGWAFSLLRSSGK
jgi:hypothetical protein